VTAVQNVPFVKKNRSRIHFIYLFVKKSADTMGSAAHSRLQKNNLLYVRVLLQKIVQPQIVPVGHKYRTLHQIVDSAESLDLCRPQKILLHTLQELRTG